jgi:hydrogenase-1 operon protein HyaF
MNRLNDIPVVVTHETENPDRLPASIIAVLHEISSHLQDLLNNEATALIDLMGFLSAPEREALKTILGEGEVSASLDTLGQSLIHETLVPGVWWVKHLNSDNQPIAENIEITRIPEILRSDSADIRDGLDALNGQLDELAAELNATGEQKEDEQRRHTG